MIPVCEMFGEDVWFIILQFLNEEEFRSLRSSHPTMKTVVDNYTRKLRLIEFRLSQFFEDVEYLKSLLRTTNSVVSGSIVLQTILSTRFKETSDLDIYIPANDKTILNWYFQFLYEEDYILTSKPSSRSRYFHSKFKVYDFFKKWKVQIIVCENDPYLFVQSSFALSCVKNWYDGTVISTLHLKYTKDYIAVYENEEKHLITRPNTIQFVKKYMNRGFQVLVKSNFLSTECKSVQIFKPPEYRMENSEIPNFSKFYYC